jgi:hypothetical protein
MAFFALLLFRLPPGGRPAFLTPAPEVVALGVAVLVVAGAMVLYVGKCMLVNCFHDELDAQGRTAMGKGMEEN